MVIDKLINALIAKWVATSALTSGFPANASGPFRDEATADAALPLCVMEVVPDAPLTDAFGNVISADVSIIFKVVAEGHNAAAALMALILAAYDNVTLSLTGGTQIGMYRNGEPIPTRAGDDFDGDEVWQWAVVYTYQIQ